MAEGIEERPLSVRNPAMRPSGILDHISLGWCGAASGGGGTLTVSDQAFHANRGKAVSQNDMSPL